MNKIILLFLAIGWLNGLFGQVSPKREFRGAWVSTVYNVDYPSTSGLSVASQKTQFINQINQLKIAGLNAVFIQVRPSCDAFYDSSIEPWSEWLNGTQGESPVPYYDPLVFYVEECHKRGLELHAWVNPYRALADLNGQSIASNHVTVLHPSWCVTYQAKKILNPGLPAVRNYVTTIVMDIVRRYDIDGMHFDDYFYPYPASGVTFNDAAAFSADPRGFTNLSNWRRDNVNIFINKIHDSIKAAKPWVRFGVSPFGIWKNNVPAGITGLSSYNDIYCDPINWLQNANVDYVMPQLYWLIGGSQDFNALSNWWGTQCLNYNRHCLAGLATYRLDPANGNWANSEIRNQINQTRTINNKVQGYSCFSSLSIVNNTKLIRDTLRTHKNRYLSIMPAMTWDNSIAPNLVTNISYALTANNITLNWSLPTAASDGDLARYFMIYRFTNGQAVNLNSSIYMAGRTNRDTTAFVDNFTLPTGQNVQYAITSIDRYGNESAPAYYNICNNCDPIAPTVSTTIPDLWQTNNFTATFTDEDDANGSGIDKGYYNVEQYNGSKWIANQTRGFLVDDYNATIIDPSLTSLTGSWTQTLGKLQHSDVSINNTNIYTTLNQTISNRYVYDFRASIGGAGVSRRAGLHIFSDDATQTERGNSILIWFRLDDDKIQLFRTTNNTLGNILINNTFNFVADQEYNFRIIYDRIEGEIKVYIDGILALTYLFADIINSGNAISFRTGNSVLKVNDFRVLRSRSTTAGITIGAANSNDVSFQNPNPTTPSGRLNTFNADNNNNLSPMSTTTFNVDYTVPSNVTNLNDGVSGDIDTINVFDVSANYGASIDSHSDVFQYEYALGNSIGATDLINWTPTNSLDFTQLALPLVVNQIYFVSVRSTNGAGLVSSPVSSDGFVYYAEPADTTATTVSLMDLDSSSGMLIYPNPFVDEISIICPNGNISQIALFDLSGKRVDSWKNVSIQSGEKTVLNLVGLSQGIYVLKYLLNGKFYEIKLTK